MLWHASALKGFSIEATDGSLGTVDDFLFDDKSWLLRWAIIDTGKWLPGRQVLLPFNECGSADFEKRQFRVKLTMDQVKNSPDLGEHPSISRQNEAALFLHYGWIPYWGGNAYPMSNAMAVPYEIQPPASSGLPRAGGLIEPGFEQDDPNLRSVVSVIGYHIHATDGEIGHVEDFLINDAGWKVPTVIVDTANWWGGQDVSIPTSSIQKIDWDTQMVYLNLNRQNIKDSPLDRHNDSPSGLLAPVLSS